MTFWDHLDELRGRLFRVLAAVAVVAVGAFCLKDLLFSVIMAPKSDAFISYRLMRAVVPSLPSFQVDMVNIEMAQQFLVHVRMSLWAALLVVLPYVIYEVLRFVGPGLYSHERRFTIRAVAAGYLLFVVGMLLGYFLIFPLTFRFLATYQVSAEVPNVISLTSYISVFLLLLLMMGLIFELPVLCWLLAKVGLLTAAPMRHYRRHAIVVIIVLAAVITPTGDAFTLSVVSLPIYLLYELSIAVVKRTESIRKD